MNSNLKYILNTTLFILSIPIYFGITNGLIDLIQFEAHSSFRSILFSFFIFIYIPFVPFLLQFSFKEQRLFYITQLKKNNTKILLLILSFTLLTIIINFLFSIDASDGYQEVEFLFLWIFAYGCYTYLFSHLFILNI